MKITNLARRLCLGILFSAGLTALGGTALAALIAPVPLYRLFNPSTGDHFYTTSLEEAFSAASNLSYKYETVGGQCFPVPVTGTVPLHRLYNAAVSDHFYTTNITERDIAVASLGYVSEGVACSIFPNQVRYACPLHRLFNATTEDHFYTLSWSEALRATTLGYAYEAQAGFLFPPAGTTCPQ